MITKYKLFESEKEPNFQSKKEKYEDIGEIRYRLYEDGILVFMGSYVDKEHRGKKIFDKMLQNLISKQKKGTTIYVPLTKDFLVPYFKKFGFEITKGPIRYWGDLDNSVNVKKTI